MKRQDEKLSTADLARASERPNRGPLDEIDVRGRDEEQIRAGEAVMDTPVPPASSAGRVPPADAARPKAPAPAAAEQRVALFRDTDAGDLRKRWSDIQTGFVDEPRRAVEQADSLVVDVMKRLAEGFASERARLETQWDRGDNITTEDLRVTLQRYRSFFDRLLAV